MLIDETINLDQQRAPPLDPRPPNFTHVHSPLSAIRAAYIIPNPVLRISLSDFIMDDLWKNEQVPRKLILPSIVHHIDKT